jgi:hypothetical protein
MSTPQTLEELADALVPAVRAAGEMLALGQTMKDAAAERGRGVRFAFEEVGEEFSFFGKTSIERHFGLMDQASPIRVEARIRYGISSPSAVAALAKHWAVAKIKGASFDPHYALQTPKNHT